MILNKIKLKLTEKEIDTIIFLSKSENPGSPIVKFIIIINNKFVN